MTWDGTVWKLGRLYLPPRYGNDWEKAEMGLNGVIYDLGL